MDIRVPKENVPKLVAFAGIALHIIYGNWAIGAILAILWISFHKIARPAGQLAEEAIQNEGF